MIQKRVNQELSALKKKFRAFYDEKLYGDYVELEEKRKPYLMSFYRRAAGLALFAVIFLYFIVVSEEFRNFMGKDGPAQLLGIVAIVWGTYVWWPVRTYKEDTKKLVMDKILSFWGDLAYKASPGKVHSQQVLEKSLLFKRFNKCDFDDCFEGSYNGVKIAVSEQELHDVHGLGKNRSDEQIFKGILISLDMPKQFCGQTVVGAKGIVSAKMVLVALALYSGLLGVLVHWNIIHIVGALGLGVILPVVCFVLCGGAWGIVDFVAQRRKKLQDVMLEDVVFDKHWKVCSTDQIEARFVLTPGFMERMLEVKKRFKGDKIEFSFWDNKVLIAVHTNKDMFETTSLFCSALSYEKVSEVIYQFWAVFSVVDLLLGKNRESA